MEELLRKLPRGASSLPKKDALKAQRLRLIHATALSVAERGYAATTIADITKSAGVSRTTFYEIFKDKEDCYLFGFMSLSEAHLKSVSMAMASSQHLAERCILGQRAYVARIDVNPAYAHAFIVEAEAASPGVRAALVHVQAQLVRLTKAWMADVQASFPEVPPCSHRTYQMLTAGTRHFVVERAQIGAKRSEEALDELARFSFATLGLYAWAQRVGPSQARQWGNPLR